MSTLKAAMRLARPQQWIKNIFVFAVLIFAGRALDLDAIKLTLLTFLSFCLASSSIYFLNDFKDIDEDRRHPEKRGRPLAAGDLPAWVGIAGFLVLLAAAVVVPTLFINRITMLTIVLYILLNIGYSLGLKHVVIIDVIFIASGFVLRILAGSAALSVLPSTWLVLCAVMISLFLGFTKRRAEVTLLGDRATEHRKVLAHYSPAFLDQAISIVTAATVLGYVLYTVDDRTVELVGSRALILSVPFVLYGIFRYLYLVYHAKTAGDPTRTVVTDIPILVTGAIWGIFCMLVIFFGKDVGEMLF
jgi:4-hydroxybenzoate polyprenyltransferase